VSTAPAVTRALAARLAAVARPGDLVALDGPLGAGKTEFTRGFAAGLGVADRVTSPSFVLMAEHEGRLPLFHLDGYRLAGPDDAWASGLLDERRADGVTVVEWAVRFGRALPAARLAITIDGAGDEPRTLTLRATGRRHRRLLEAALGPDGGERLLVALDTSTRRAVVALGGMDGRPLAIDAWEAGHRHGEELLVRLDALLVAAGGATRRAGLDRIEAVVVGTGPGAFTGLRVGLATAKGLAVGLDVPLVGVSTAAALLHAAGVPDGAVLLPAGPSDRTMVTSAGAVLVPAGREAPLPDDAVLVAVDLPGRAPDDALRRGAAALDGLPAALLGLGAARLARGERDDAATLAPEYVTLPRGVVRPGGPVTLRAGREA
jgi:tRNA threonylcarbamoyladenosine biosynthesis protein TsaE